MVTNFGPYSSGAIIENEEIKIIILFLRNSRVKNKFKHGDPCIVSGYTIYVFASRYLR